MLSCRYCRALALVLLVGLSCGQHGFQSVSFSVLPHQYNCGEHSMQLLVLPRQSFYVRFKVVDEFETPFEVTNCSICLHWVTSNENGAIFSAGYQGCHVQHKNGRNYLKVRVEELTRYGHVATTHDINMVCPKPEEYGLTPEDGIRHMPQPQMPQPGLGRPVPAQPQPGLGRPLPAQPQPGLGRPLPAQPQPGLGRPVPAQPQPGLGRPVPHFSPIYGTGTHLTMEQCRVLGSKIPCVDTYDQETCHQASCCYDDSDLSIPCYYGNTVTVRCLKEGHFILVVSRDMSDYPVVLDTVKLSYAQAGCDPVSRTEAFLVFRFPLTRCGTTVQVLGDKLIYENQLISDIDIQNGPDGSITRDSTFILHARCIYNATGFLPVQAEVLLPPTPAPVSQMGPLRLELRIATDASYKSYYLDGDYPVVKVLRDPVYVEVRILQRTDPSLVLVLHDCWATPSANPLEQLQWPILMDGCPFEGDNYRTQRMPPGPALAEMPFPTHYQRFIISTFTFVDSGSQMLLSQLVYLFCSASACIPSQIDPCRTTCSARSSPRGRRFLNPLNRTEPVDLASSHGPVIFPDAEIKQLVSNSSETQTDFNSVALGLLSVVTVSSVVILLTVLWRWNRKRS